MVAGWLDAGPCPCQISPGLGSDNPDLTEVGLRHSTAGEVGGNRALITLSELNNTKQLNTFPGFEKVQYSHSAVPVLSAR